MQICGQLQHPGVVPVLELGTLADHRPFFTMKLVKGQTLALLLAESFSSGDDLPRFLSIFIGARPRGRRTGAEDRVRQHAGLG